MNKIHGAGGGEGGLGSLIVPSTAMSSTLGIGKGLQEPCSPNRAFNVFGVDLNTPPASIAWNCTPIVTDPVTTLDLSTIRPNHEAIIALLMLSNIPAGQSRIVKHQWYRDRDNKLLFEYSYTIPDPGASGYTAWAWYGVYSYIGYIPIEISENGSYHVSILLNGVQIQQATFTVSGITLKTATVHIGSISWDVFVATTSIDQQNGLSSAASMVAGTGMLFDLGSSRTVTVDGILMLFPLDVVFIGSNGNVTEAVRSLQPTTTVIATTPCRYFLEVNSGEAAGVVTGNVVTITGYTPAASGIDLNSIISLMAIMMLMQLMTSITEK